MLKRMQAKNKWEEAEVHWLSSSHSASTQAAISHEDSHTSNWLDNTIYSLAHAGVEAHIGLEYALGISPYSLDQLALRGQPLPDLINFGIGATVGYGMQAALILEAGPIRIAEGLYQGSAELISKVSELWGKNAAKSLEELNNLAHNRTLHETYKAELRQNMEKPIVQNTKLQSVIDKLYRPNAKIGSGSTADAIRHELATGEQVGGKIHFQKGEEALTQLDRWLKTNPTAASGDRAAAENIIHDLNDALRYIQRPQSITHNY